MPLNWKGIENPYWLNYFTVLQVGPAVSRRIIPEVANKVLSTFKGKKSLWIRMLKLSGAELPSQPDGTPDQRQFRLLEEREVTEASSRLIDETIWAEEVLLVHPASNMDNREIMKTCAAVLEQAAPTPHERELKLVNPAALAALAPRLGPEDIPLPDWKEFGIPTPGAPEDRQLDIQFDL
jgi:hypothetical protein